MTKIESLKERRNHFLQEPGIIHQVAHAGVTNYSSPEEKIALFLSLFRGREDVYTRRWKNLKTGKSGYQPACRNDWVRGICHKPTIKCSNCSNRDYLPVTTDVIHNHLAGYDQDNTTDRKSTRDFTIGVYPLLPDETCWFLAIDFDKKSWILDCTAFLDICRQLNVPAVLERSRSGNGGHIWIFFSEPAPAVLARQLGSYLLTETMENRPEIGLDSYDRIFPNQDTMPAGGLGNLIALPLQRKPRDQGNSLFLDRNFEPYIDQWAFLSSVKIVGHPELECLVEKGLQKGRIMGTHLSVIDDEGEEPWNLLLSRSFQLPHISGPLPEDVKLVLGNQLYLEKKGVSPSLINRIIRLAAFPNPEFYKAQAMRLPTYDKPRMICCAEDYPKHIALPRGCLKALIDLFQALNIRSTIIDERNPGTSIHVAFKGSLKPEQKEAVEKLSAHEMGLLAATTAFGKTVVAIDMIAKRSVNTLILVHRRQILDQWIARLSAFLDINTRNIGQIGSGKYKPTGFIDVALIQSLGRGSVVDDIVGQYGHLIIDECHHLSAKSFENVARRCRAKHVIGLSATVTRKDGHHPIIFMQCGPVRYQDDARRQAAVRPFAHRVIPRMTGFRMPVLPNSDKKTTITDIYAALIADEHRNDLIFNDVLLALEKKRSPVLITERKEHLQYFADRFSRFARHVIVMKGGMGSKQRRSISEKMAGIPDHEERLLIATGSYLGEGFDDPRLDTLFLTLPISWKGTVSQYAGRLHRLHENKSEVIIYDYVDFEIPMTHRMFLKRIRGYRAIGYQVEELSEVVPK